MVGQKANSSEILTQISITLKKYVIDRFIYLHCLKYVPMKATQVTKCKGFYSFKLEKNLKAEYILSCGKNNAFNMKTVFKYTVGLSQCNQ